MAHNRSFLSKIAESILNITKPDHMTSKEKAEEYLTEKSKKDLKYSKFIFKSMVFEGMECSVFGNKDKADRVILFIHGGAYVDNLNLQHHTYCSYLSSKLDAYVVAPAYPLAPNNCCEDTFGLITNLYKELIKINKDIVIMGDSAGGGLALSFCQYLNKIDLPQPKNIIVFSPWVDLSMDGNYENEDTDPVLGINGLKVFGKSWAGNLDIKDYKVSPLFGDNLNLAKTLIFVGDNEIFYSDVKKYYDNLKKDGVDAKLIVGWEMFHIYPMFPISEAKEAIKEIKKEIME